MIAAISLTATHQYPIFLYFWVYLKNEYLLPLKLSTDT